MVTRLDRLDPLGAAAGIHSGIVWPASPHCRRGAFRQGYTCDSCGIRLFLNEKHYGPRSCGSPKNPE
jgi:hypothetical protein